MDLKQTTSFILILALFCPSFFGGEDGLKEAEALFRDGRYEECLRLVTDAHTGPDVPAELLRLRAMSKYALAEKIRLGLTSVNVEQSQVRRIGELYDGGETDIVHYIAERPSDTGAYALRALFRTALRKTDLALSDLDGELLKDVATPELDKARGLCHFYRNEFQQAEQYLAPLEDGNATDISFLVALAMSAHRNMRFSTAIRIFRRLLELDPRSPYALYHIGFAYYHSGDLDNARAAFDRVLALGVDAPGQILEYRGVIHHITGKFALAEADYSAALRTGSLGARNRLAGFYEESGEYRKLEKLARETMQNDAQIRQRCLARAAYGLGRYDEAEAAAAEIVRQGSFSEDDLSFWCTTMARRDKDLEIADWLSQRLRDKPELIVYRLLLGGAYARQGRLKWAEQHLSWGHHMALSEKNRNFEPDKIVPYARVVRDFEEALYWVDYLERQK